MENWILHPFWTHFPVALFGMAAGMMAVAASQKRNEPPKILSLQLVLAWVSGIPALLTGLLDTSLRFQASPYPVWLQIHIATAFSLIFFSGIVLVILYKKTNRHQTADPLSLLLFAMALLSGLVLLLLSGTRLTYGHA
jgi:uncharacterized membrane protein